MKFEASHYDIVEWNPKPLDPGTAFYKPTKIAKVAEVAPQRCSVIKDLSDHGSLIGIFI